MEWSIQQLARLAHTTSRTLRHYDDIGILPPTRLGSNGYRYYDESALIRLQRILLLRELGLGLPQIAVILEREDDEAEVLANHVSLLRQEQERLGRQIAAVERTIATLEGKEQLMAEEMFAGFDHTKYQTEVEERWGPDAYAQSDEWWRGLNKTQRQDWVQQVAQLNSDWQDAAQDPATTCDSERAQQLAARHVDWLRGVPGTPAAEPGADVAPYVRGLAEMYVADERFAANYGGTEGAEFVRDSLVHYLEVGSG